MELELVMYKEAIVHDNANPFWAISHVGFGFMSMTETIHISSSENLV